MKLSQVYCRYGAPMGRSDHHAHGMDDLTFEIEWVPFLDGGYDVGGAYWGGPDNLYCAVAELDGEELARHFIRADSRWHAFEKLLEDYPDANMLPENGSLIKQTISWLEEYLDGLDPEDRELAAGTEEDISCFESLLEQKGLT